QPDGSGQGPAVVTRKFGPRQARGLREGSARGLRRQGPHRRRHGRHLCGRSGTTALVGVEASAGTALIFTYACSGSAGPLAGAAEATAGTAAAAPAARMAAGISFQIFMIVFPP